MTEPPTSSPDPAAPGERDELLGTRSTSHDRARPACPITVSQRLDEGIAQALILVCAPAGFGKNTLLTDWGHQCKLPDAWLSLDEGSPCTWRRSDGGIDRARGD